MAERTVNTEERDQAAQTPLDDLRRGALEHYEKVTSIAHEWHSVIPKAINAYFDSQLAQPADDAATRMRDKCVDAIKSLRAEPHGAAYNNAINDAIHKVGSLTLDSIE